MHDRLNISGFCLVQLENNERRCVRRASSCVYYTGEAIDDRLCSLHRSDALLHSVAPDTLLVIVSRLVVSFTREEQNVAKSSTKQLYGTDGHSTAKWEVEFRSRVSQSCEMIQHNIRVHTICGLDTMFVTEDSCVIVIKHVYEKNWITLCVIYIITWAYDNISFRNLDCYPSCV